MDFGQPMFKGTRVTLLSEPNSGKHDPLRCYVDAPGVAGWREHLDPITESRHWSHVAMRLTTWSLREVIRYGGLEEFLMVGEWGLFMHVPEEIPLYEELTWKAPYYDNLDCAGEPAGYLARGEIVASLGLRREFIAEILVTDSDSIVRLFYSPYRFPNEKGKRLLQKLPTREHNEDAMAIFNLTSGEFRVLGMPWLSAESGDYLDVSTFRDPRSQPVGRLKVGLVVSISQIIGTRAQLSRVEDGGIQLLGGWVSLMTLDGAPTLERCMYETEGMREAEEHKRHLIEITAIIEAGGDEAIEFPWAEKPPPPPWTEPIIISHTKQEILFTYRWDQQMQYPLADELEDERVRKGYNEEEWWRRVAIVSKYHRELKASVDFNLLEDMFPMTVGLKGDLFKKFKRQQGAMVQRDKMTGGWRQMIDPVWKKLMYVEPISGRATWSLMEVLRTGGLEDLLLSRTWHIACVDPMLLELQKDDEWQMPVYAEGGLIGHPVRKLDKGTFIIVKHFETNVMVATLLLPPLEKGGACWTGYCKYRLNDGRAILRSMLPYPEDMETTHEDGEPSLAEEPEYDVLEGPYEVCPPDDDEELPVTEDQDLSSPFMHCLSRGYRICEINAEDGFDEVFGLRAHLPDLEGGGWASLFTSDARPLFKKEPAMPAAEKGIRRFSKVQMPTHICVRWPEMGVPGMPKLGDPGMPKPIEKPDYVSALPTLLERLGGGRALCDWNRITLDNEVKCTEAWSAYQNVFTHIRTTLDELLRLQVWKIVLLERDTPMRDQLPPHSAYAFTWPRGSLMIAEWVHPTNAVRLLVPDHRDDHKPRHLFSDLGNCDGSYIVPLLPGHEFWVEPKGGHLPYEVQCEDEPGDAWEFVVREEKDPESKRVVGLRRADAVQIAQTDGIYARVVITYRLGIAEFPHGGWVTLFDESGWCQLKLREPGIMHPLQIQAEGIGELPTPRPMFGTSKAQLALKPQPRENMLFCLTYEQCEINGLRQLFDLRLRQKNIDIQDFSAHGVLRDNGGNDIDIDDLENVYEDQFPVTGFIGDTLPALLWQIGELEQASNLARDWHEQMDPVWGRLYYVNRWSGQVIHSLAAGGVYAVAVRLTLWLTNITINNLKVTEIEIKKQAEMRAGPADVMPGDEEKAWSNKLIRIESMLREPVCALVDVPLEMMDVKIVDVPSDEPIADTASEEDGSTRVRRSIGDKLPNFKIVATITAPGAHAAWAATGLKEEMADGEKFNLLVCGIMNAMPDLQNCKFVDQDPIVLAQATLDEVDVPPWVRPPTPPPPENPPPPVDEEFVQFRKNLRYAKPKILDLKSCKALNLKTFAAGDLRALAEGLDLAAKQYDPFVEEVHFWEVGLDDFQAVCFKQAFERGRLAILTTLLLDGNNIGAVGAQALGDGLRHCELLRELSVAQNPIGIGFVHICKNICAGLVVLNASQAKVNDTGAVAVGQSLPGWSKMSALRLSGNSDITLRAAEVVARGVLACPSLKLADLRGSAAKPHEARVARIFQDADNDPSRMRV